MMYIRYTNFILIFYYMTAKYWVAVRPQTNDKHAIHRDGCPFMPDDSRRTYLGAFQSDSDAQLAGQMHYEKSVCCRFCACGKDSLTERLLSHFESLVYCVN